MESPALRGSLYGLLSDFFLYPDPQVSPFFDPELLEEAADLLETEAPPVVQPGHLDELRTAYTGLFINRPGGIRAHLYGAVYLESEGRLMGASSRGVLAAYREAGILPETATEPPDSLSLELAFLAHLADMEEQALQAGDALRTEDARHRQAEFCRTFLHPWVFEFCRRLLEDDSAHPLYRWGALLLERFSCAEQRWMQRLASE